MSAPSVIVFPSPQRNIKFLQAVVGVSEYLNAHVCGFTSDPDDKACPDANSRWAGGRWSDIGPGLSPDMNTYFSISTYTGNTRGKEFFRACHAVVLDDVGTPKASAADVLMVLGDPSWKIETSPGNEQWGYALLPPETNAAKVEAILDALIDRGLTDAGGQNVTRYARLPVGSNTKRVLGPVPWVHVARPGPSPLRKFGADELLRRLAVPDRDWSLVTSYRRRWMSPSDLADGGLIIRTLESWGDLTGTKTRDGGWHMTRCPWDHEHGTPGDNRAAVWPWGAFKCFHGHCVHRDRDDLLAWFNKKLEDESAGLISHLAQLEFDVVQMIATASAFQDNAVPGQDPGRGGLWDPWESLPIPEWPGGVLPDEFENRLRDLAERDGLDLGSLVAAYLTAASGAADKRALLQPYAGSAWVVRPTLWTMLIATSGQRKSPIMTFAQARLKAAHDQNMRRYGQALRKWKALPASLRQAPPDATALLAQDTTVEKLQDWMASNSRGLLYARDELAALFDFGRYSSGTGAAERAFFLETQDGGSHTVARVKGTIFIEECALAILGGTQQDRLAEFKGLESDGLLPRFGAIMMNEERAGSQAGAGVPVDTAVLEDAITGLLTLTPVLPYATDADGEDVVREMERLGLSVSRGGFGAGFSGFARKLHGTMARTALLLHLLDGGASGVVPVSTVRRARRYAQFLALHARVFYAGLAGSREQNAQAIGSWLLRHSVNRVTAGQLRTNIAVVKRTRDLKEIHELVEPLVIGGWLGPENPWPNNKVWLVNPKIREVFMTRVGVENKRVQRIKEDMNHLGRYRDT